MTSLERAILMQFDTDDTRSMIRYYRHHAEALVGRGEVCSSRLARHLESATHQHAAAYQDELLSDIIIHSLVGVNWEEIADALCEKEAE